MRGAGTGNPTTLALRHPARVPARATGERSGHDLLPFRGSRLAAMRLASLAAAAWGALASVCAVVIGWGLGDLSSQERSKAYFGAASAHEPTLPGYVLPAGALLFLLAAGLAGWSLHPRSKARRAPVLLIALGLLGGGLVVASLAHWVWSLLPSKGPA